MKKLLVALSAIVQLTFYSASAQSYQWANRIGSSAGVEVGNCIAVDGSGNIYITGKFQGTADFDPSGVTANLVPLGSEDIFFAKYDASGNYIWAKSIGSSGVGCTGNGIAVDGNGNVYITGFFDGTADFDPSGNTVNLTTSGSADIFVAKYDASGNYLWANKIGSSSGYDVGNSIAVDGSGNIYFTGYFAGTADFDPSGVTANLSSNAGSNDIFIAKYGTAGNYLWANNFGSTGYDISYGIAVDGTGNAYITGYFTNTADFEPGAGTTNLTTAGSADIFLAKYDASGNYVSAKSLGGTSGDYGAGITLDGSGNVYLTGRFNGTADFDPSGVTANLVSAGFDDIFFAKYDASLNYILAKGFGGTGGDYGNSIAVDGSGNIYVAGYFATTTDFDPGAGTANLTTVGASDIFFAKYDASGTYQWASRIGSSSSDYAQSITVDGNGKIYMTGSFNGTADFDPGNGTANLTPTGTNDLFYAAYCSLSAVASGSALACYGDNNGIATITTSGSGTFTYSWSSGQTTSAATGLNAGIYTCTVTSSSGCTTVQSASVTEPSAALASGISATQTNCSSNSGTATANPSGGVSPYSYSWNNAQTTSVALALGVGGYTVTVTDANGCTATASVSVTYKQAPGITITTNQNVSCFGLSNGSVSANPSGGTAPYTYSWTGGQTSQNATGLSANNYTVTVADANGCTGTATVNISQPAVLTATVSVVSHASCGNADGSVMAIQSGGTSPFTYLWDNNATTSQLNNVAGGSYSVAVADVNGCTASATGAVNYSVPLSSVPVCLITVDSLSQYNNIVWDKPVNIPIDSFIIHREISLNNYQPIGAVPYAALSLFVDTVRTKYFPNTGDPNSGTYRYKLQIRDTCGNYSALSPYHNTIFMTNNSGNFSWVQLYTIEGSSNPVNSYVLMRDDNNNGTWHAINSVSGTQQNVTDPAYASWASTANWRIETQWAIQCTPSIKYPEAQGIIKTTKSNTFKLNNPTGANESALEKLMNVYPNPGSGEFMIQTVGLEVLNLEMYNVFGKKVFSELANRTVYCDLPNGIYLAHIQTEIGLVVRKIVVSR